MGRRRFSPEQIIVKLREAEKQVILIQVPKYGINKHPKISLDEKSILQVQPSERTKPSKFR